MKQKKLPVQKVFKIENGVTKQQEIYNKKVPFLKSGMKRKLELYHLVTNFIVKLKNFPDLILYNT